VASTLPGLSGAPVLLRAFRRSYLGEIDTGGVLFIACKSLEVWEIRIDVIGMAAI
jgi:hypothetical protein